MSEKCSPDPQLLCQIASARNTLARKGIDHTRSTRVSARVSLELLEAARRHSGMTSNSDLISIALELIAAGDLPGDHDFGAWLISQRGRLSKDFELAF